MGNHDESILNHGERWLKEKILPKNPDKKTTVQQLKAHHFDYLKQLPYLHVVDDLGVILVHGGVWNKIPLYKQPTNVCRAQLIHPNHLGKSKWFNMDHDGTPEEENNKLGWKRWYHVYDYPQDIIFGHSTFYQPMIYTTPHSARVIGVDTGSAFGGLLTACIYSQNEPAFISVKNKKVYCISTTRQFWEAE